MSHCYFYQQYCQRFKSEFGKHYLFLLKLVISTTAPQKLSSQEHQWKHGLNSCISFKVTGHTEMDEGC